MPLKRSWRCPFCTGTTMTSPRHWNVQRHIRLMHGLTGEPVDHSTGLIRFQLQSRVGMNYGDGNFQRSASTIYQPREIPSWEFLYKMKDLKVLEALKEIRENSAYIVQQNSLIMSQLARIINAGRF
jgi:hypothetical protein